MRARAGAGAAHVAGEPESVSTRPPALSAVTSVERSGVATARSTMVLPAVSACLGGRSTAFTMCTTPLEASMSAVVTCALLMYTLESLRVTSTSLPSTVGVFSWFFRSAACTEPEATWYVSTSTSCALCAGSSR